MLRRFPRLSWAIVAAVILAPWAAIAYHAQDTLTSTAIFLGIQ